MCVYIYMYIYIYVWEKRTGEEPFFAQLQGQPLPPADLLCSAEIQPQRPAETLRIARFPIV